MMRQPPSFADCRKAVERYDEQELRTFLRESLPEFRRRGATDLFRGFDEEIERRLAPWLENTMWLSLIDDQRVNQLFVAGHIDEAAELIVKIVSTEHQWQVELLQVMSRSAGIKPTEDFVLEVLDKVIDWMFERNDSSSWYDRVNPYLCWAAEAAGVQIVTETRRDLDRLISACFSSYILPTDDRKQAVVNAVAWAAVERELDS